MRRVAQENGDHPRAERVFLGTGALGAPTVTRPSPEIGLEPPQLHRTYDLRRAQGVGGWRAASLVGDESPPTVLGAQVTRRPWLAAVRASRANTPGLSSAAGACGSSGIDSAPALRARQRGHTGVSARLLAASANPQRRQMTFNIRSICGGSATCGGLQRLARPPSRLRGSLRRAKSWRGPVHGSRALGRCKCARPAKSL